MNSKNYVSSLLAGNYENHILPFLWMREQTEKTLRTEIEKIAECGIGAVCLESRPHPDFMGPGWWHDFDIVLDEAKKRNMKIWILDDAHFPTGMANNQIPEKYPERARKYIMTQYTDCVGPVVEANLDVNLMMTKQFTWVDFGKKIEKPILDKTELLSVTAARVIHGDVISSDIIDITDRVKDGWLTWDVPEGVWRICVSFTTYDFGSNNNYINYIDRTSVHTLIEAVYELHYAHYKEEFGKTIAGFFSDEPGFYNVPGYKFRNAIGRKNMALPWCEELQEVYEKNRENWRTALPYLWLDADDVTLSAQKRRYYMDQVSSLYSKNFSCQLGDWCRAHDVKYIGHVVEDYDEHTRLGCGTGHYFRAMAGQSWAGIDDIGGQIIPGNDISTRHGVTDDCDAEFYHYCLAKLGASAAAVDPAKHGQLMCEMFGAYGWNFGVKSMKWLTDFLLFQGVNNIVPHAFSMADYPDIDCPPHFYARGNNPEFPYFAELMKYANRLCSLLGGGRNMPQVALMYPAESDWMNESMKIQTVGKELIRHQIDFEILPTDVFKNKEKYLVEEKEGTLTVNSRTMKAVIVMETGFIDADLLAAMKECRGNDIPVYFIGKLPSYVVGENVRRDFTAEDAARFRNIALENLAAAITEAGFTDVEPSAYTPELLATHFEKNGDIYCFFNTDLSKTIDVDVKIPKGEQMVAYDVYKNRLVTADVRKKEAEETILHLHLGPYESRVILAGVEGTEEVKSPEEETKVSEGTGKTGAQAEREHVKELSQKVNISDGWTVTAVRSIDYPNFPEPEETAHLVPYSRQHPEFAGVMRYEKTFVLDDGEKRLKAVFAPQHIYEVAEVFVNGISAGKQLTPPYRWEIGGLLKNGENTIRVEGANTPTSDTLHAESPFGPDRQIIEPSGMFGKIVIE